jgi:hypothetical protein
MALAAKHFVPSLTAKCLQVNLFVTQGSERLSLFFVHRNQLKDEMPGITIKCFSKIRIFFFFFLSLFVCIVQAHATRQSMAKSHS